jgi:von Willebrand factor type A domain
MPAVPFTFAHPHYLWAGLALAAAAVVVALVRRPAVPVLTRVLWGLGLVLLALAAGGAIWHRPAAGEVTVMVDLSPSTRNAGYRDRGALEARVRQLLGRTPYRIRAFADGASDLPDGAALPDLPAEQTTYDAPAGGLVLLFSDGHFQGQGGTPLSTIGMPPTHVAIDAALDAPADAAVEALEMRVSEVAVRLRNTTAARSLTLTGAGGPSPTTAPTGSVVLSRAIGPQAATVSARLSPGDAWPENDALSGPVPPPSQSERWLVTRSNAAPPAGWRGMSPEALSSDPTAYLAPAVIVLDNVAAADLSPLQQDRLRQYVRDLGGGLVITGGDRAFAAGGYPGSVLETLSPLASTPPEPTTHWIVLADGSGSMNASAGDARGGAGGATRWQYAADAVRNLPPHLPPEDLLSVGSFAKDVAWWASAGPVREVRSMPLPPPGVAPGGPTDLRPALEEVIARAEPALPKQLLLLTDADAEVGDVSPLIEGMKRKNLRLHLLALGEGRGLAALREVVNATGGQLVQQQDAAKWAQAVRDLARAASPQLLERDPLAVTFVGDLARLPGRRATPWNRTWLKEGATALGEARRRSDGERIIPAAHWNVGEGRAGAAAFAPTPAELGALADLLARPPRDPRFRVTWETGPRLVVKVDATDGEAYLNARNVSLEIAAVTGGEAPAAPRAQAVPQTGPGRYEVSLPAPRSPSLATLRVDGQVLERIAVAGRYAPEYDAIGNDRAALRALAERTGGKLIEPDMTGPIDFRWPPRDVSLTPWLAAAGGMFVALGLIWWRAR